MHWLNAAALAQERGAMAAWVVPLHASARHQAMQHFVAKAQWRDEQVLQLAAQRVVPHTDFSRGGFWILDDMGFPKKRNHSMRDDASILRRTGEAGELPVGF